MFNDPPVQTLNDRLANLTNFAAGAVVTPPTVTATPATTGSTHYSYVVAARFGADTVPTLLAITNGYASMSSTYSNTVAWSPVLAPSNLSVVYDVYRTVGGSTQGLIASGLTGTQLVDTGLVATSVTAPVRNTTVPNSVGAAPICYTTAAGAYVLLPNPGLVMLAGATPTLATLALPVATVDDGTIIKIVAMTAEAHTVTTPAAGINAASTTLTFAAVGDEATLEAYNGSWISNGVQTAAHIT